MPDSFIVCLSLMNSQESRFKSICGFEFMSAWHAGFLLFLSLMIDRLHYYIRELEKLRKTMDAAKKQNRGMEDAKSDSSLADDWWSMIACWRRIRTFEISYRRLTRTCLILISRRTHKVTRNLLIFCMGSNSHLGNLMFGLEVAVLRFSSYLCRKIGTKSGAYSILCKLTVWSARNRSKQLYVVCLW